jgi:ketosteroid isomerase-like protein
MADTSVEVVQQFFECYLEQDLTTAQRLAADDLTFTSPQDDHINRATYFDKCFPTASRVRWQELKRIVAATDEDVFVMYEYELLSGDVHRNAELITVRDGRVTKVQVFFGGAVHPGGAGQSSATSTPAV